MQGSFSPLALPGFIDATSLSAAPDNPAWLSRVARRSRSPLLLLGLQFGQKESMAKADLILSERFGQGGSRSVSFSREPT
jgi:hypothetical protein